MAFTQCKEGIFPLNDSYRGPTAVVQFSFNFVFLPGIDACTQLDAAVRAGMFGVGIIPLIKANYLRYTLEVDTSPFIDAYRVTIHLAGETDETEGTIRRPFSSGQQPGALIIGSSLVALVLAIGVIILIFGPIAYRIFNGGVVGGGEDGGGGLFPGLKIDTTTLVIGGAAIAGLLVLIAGGRKA